MHAANLKAEFIQKCKTVLRNQKAFCIFCSRVKVLSATDIVVASPEKSPELVTLQRNLHTIAPAELNEWSSAELWEPHTTLFYLSEKDLESIARHIRKHFAPFSAKVDVFSRVQNEKYELLDFVALKNV